MKYPIDKGFGRLVNIKTPLNKFILYMAYFFLSIMPKKLKDKNLSVTKISIDSYDKKKIKIYKLTPKSNNISSTIFFIHGGGFVFKGGPNHYKIAKEYAKRSSAELYFVDYRLAFNNKYETPLLDTLEAYKFMLKNKTTDNIIIIGDSAGGFLSINLINKLHNLELMLPNKQLIVYPVIDPNMTTPSMKKYIDTPMWDAKLNKKMWYYYNKNNHTVSPLEYNDYSYYPKTYIETAEFDCLHDEGILFYNKLKTANKNVLLNETYKTMHGYDFYINHPISINSINKRIDFIKNA